MNISNSKFSSIHCNQLIVSSRITNSICTRYSADSSVLKHEYLVHSTFYNSLHSSTILV